MNAPHDPGGSPRTVVDAAFPSEGTAAEQLRFLIAYALLAPSLFNTQPWRFAVEDDALVLRADPARQLPALDPDGRELVMSCGAALFNLRTAARHVGFACAVERLPDADTPDLLARVRLGPALRATADEERLFDALPHRRTERFPFADVAVRPPLLADLEAAARAEGARLAVLTEPTPRAGLAALVAEGIRAQGADGRVTDEIRAWLRRPGDPRLDGVPDAAQGPWDRRAVLWTPAADLAARTEALARSAPALAVLATPADTRADWLAAGEALEHVLLAAASEGVMASYLNAPVEVAALRPEVGQLAGGVAQAVLRLGYPVERGGTPRRPARDVIG